MMKYYKPDSRSELLHMLKDLPQARILAGGTDLLVNRKKTGEEIPAVIDIAAIEELHCIEMTEKGLYIGAGSTFTQIEECDLIKEVHPLLAEAASQIGSPQIRNRGTIGGNICNASAAADTIPALAVLDALLILESHERSREVKLKDFLLSSGGTVLENEEVLIAIILPAGKCMSKWAFGKIGRRNALAISRLNGACAFEVKNGKMSDVRLALGAATRKAERFEGVEALLEGKTPCPEVFKEAGAAVADYILEKTGRRPSSEYKLPVAADFTAWLLQKAYEGTI